MENTRTAAALLLFLLFTITSVFHGLFQPAKAQGIVSVEGTWLVTSEPPDIVGSDIGKSVTIRRKSHGEYEAIWPHEGKTIRFFGSPNEIKRVKTLTFEHLKKKFQGTGVPDSVLREAAGVQITYYYIPSPDGRTMQFLQDELQLKYSQSGHLISSQIRAGGLPTILTRVSEPAAAPKAAPAPATPKATSAPAPAKKTVTSPVAQVEARGEFYFLTKDGRKLTGAEANKVPLEEGGKVVTGKGGHVRLTLPDATTFTVGANSEIVIDKFVYDPNQTPKQVMVNMTKGVFRWVTGKTAPKYKAQMQVTLPVMAVGIRGTDFEALVGTKGRGRVALYDGQLEITEKKTGFAFILNAGQMVTFTLDGKVSRPKKIRGAPMLNDEEDD
jgi:hypothetical protein